MKTVDFFGLAEATKNERVVNRVSTLKNWVSKQLASFKKEEKEAMQAPPPPAANTYAPRHWRGDYGTRPYMRYRMKTCKGKVIQHENKLSLIIDVYNPTLSVEQLVRIATKNLRNEFNN